MRLELALDVNDPDRMIAFWSAVLDYDLPNEDRFDTPDRIYWSLVDPSGVGPRLVIQRVPEPATAKNRLHIDLHVDDIEAAASRAVTLGATAVDAQPVIEVGTSWIRLLDPEGNVFCFVSER